MFLLLILQTIQSEDDRAFLADLYNDHFQLMYDKADSIVHNCHDAEDIVQDMLAYIAEHIEKFREISCCTLPYYLVMCIRKRCIDCLRKRETVRKHIAGSMDHEAFSFEYIDSNAAFEDKVVDKIDVQRMTEAFLQLPEQLQSILEYKYLLGMSDAEIAKLLGIRKNSVRQYLTRARRATYQLCKERGYEEE